MLELGLFYIAATVSLISTVLAVTRYNAAHALIYLIISLLASAIIFYLVGAPFAAVLEVVIYAGAIMVLFVFVIMLLNLGQSGDVAEHVLLRPGMWIIPSLLCVILFIEIVYVLQSSERLLERDGRWTQRSRVGTFWTLCSGCRDRLYAATRRSGRRLSPGTALFY